MNDTHERTPRLRGRLLAAAMAGALAVLGGAAVAAAGPAAAAPSPHGAAHVPTPNHRPWLMPFNAANTSTAPAGAHLTYYGGRVISNVNVVQVIYGSGSYLPQTTSTGTPSVKSFYTGVTQSPYFDWLTEYNTTGQTIGRGTYGGLYTITPSTANNASTIQDSNIQAELAAQIDAGTLPQPTTDAAGNRNTLYTIFFRHGQSICDSGSCSLVSGGFCAYHGTFVHNGQDIYYAVEPDLTGVLGCGSSTDFNNTTSVASHELIEAVTDAEVGLAGALGPPLAWYDNTNGEIGDICNAQQGTVVGGDGVTYTVQTEFSNLVNNCIVQKTQTNDFSVVATPSSRSIAAGTSTTYTVSTAVTSGSAQSVNLAVTGLPAGATASFSPASVTAGGNSTLTVTTAGSTPASTSSLTVTGTAASGSHSAAVSLTVTPQPVLALAETDTAGGQVPLGGTFTYRLTGSITAGGPETQPSTLHVTSTLPTYITAAGTPAGSGWDCSASTTLAVSCTYLGTTPIPVGTVLPPITVPVQADATHPGATTDTATLTSADEAGDATASDTVTIVAVAPAITGNPADQYVTSSQTATFSASASGNPAPSAQWQSSSDGTTWTDVAGATGDTLSVPGASVAGNDGTRYRVVYSNSAGTATSTAATLHVGQGSSTTATMTAAGAAVVGAPRTYVATITPNPSAIAVAGTVSFTDAGAAIPSCAAVTVTSGQASCTTTYTTAGDHTIVAVYSGSTELTASTAPGVLDAIAAVTTSTGLSASPTSVVVGQPVSYSATVTTSGPGSTALDGTVSFVDGTGTAVPGCTALTPDATGAVTCRTVFTSPGSPSVTATYSGGPATGRSSSSAVTVTVAKGSTATSVTAAPNPSVVGQAVTLTATVTTVAPAQAPVTGTVTFYDGTTAISGAVSVTGGAATFTTSALAGGSHTLTALYSGDGNLNPSTSPALSQSVGRLATSLVAASPVTVSSGSLRLSPKATLTSNGTPVVGRTVTFTVGTTPVCSAVTTSTGTASCTGSLKKTPQVAGTKSYTATFAGDVTYLPSTATGALA